MRIAITGGHHNSALALIQELEKRWLQRKEILWLGHKYTNWGDREPGAEYKEIQSLGITFKEIKAGKVYKTVNLMMWLRVVLGFLQALFFLWQFKPKLIISFGGYLAVPTVLAGWLLRIPSVTHEQTVVSGLANRVIAPFAQKIFITWPQSEKYFPARKVVLTGLPLRHEIFERRTDRFEFGNNLPTVYITGGKQGSHIINMAVREILPELLKRMNVIHQCGSSTVFNNHNQLKGTSGKLENLPGRYLLQPYFYQDEIGSVFAAADLVVSRAGAHIIYELAALGKPGILVPIPWVSHNEQYKNARILANLGMSKIIPENELTKEKALLEIEEMLQNLTLYKQQAEEARKLIRFDAAERMSDEILKLL